MALDEQGAARDLDFIRDVLTRTQRRIDAHAYQFVWWGSLVMVWYPLANFLPEHWPTITVTALVLGFVVSGLLGWWIGRKPRIEGDNTFIVSQIQWTVFACIGGGIVLSAIAPATGFVAGPQMNTLWALVYAVMAFFVGVVYTPEWKWSGAIIFVSALVAMFVPDWAGLIVGPPMGLGLVIPGLMAERRVRRMREEDAVAHGA